MIGLDLLENERFNLAINRSGIPFLKRILRSNEMKDNPEEVWGVIFSAKESFIKAVGGIPPNGRFIDIEVIVTSKSTFKVVTYGAFHHYLKRNKVKEIKGEYLLFHNKLILTLITFHKDELEGDE